MTPTVTAATPRLSAKKTDVSGSDTGFCGERFSVEHFRLWAAELVLDSGEVWLLEPFQVAFIAAYFEGRRENWLIVPEGNGKTTLMAGLALYCCEFRLNANVPIAASSREQAEIMYRQAEGFVFRSPRLYKPMFSPIQAAKGKRKVDVPRFLPLEGHRRINHYLGGRIQVFAADDRTGDGVIPTDAFLDELHRHRDLKLYRTWGGKMEKRGGQIATISTAGEPGSEFEEARERIRQSGEVTRVGGFVSSVSDQLVLHEWAVPEGGDVEDMEVVKSANPFSGVTVGKLREKRDSPTMTFGHWRRFVCNLATRSEMAAIQEAEWFAAAGGVIPVGQHVDVGLDVAWKWDTTAAVPLWMKSDTERVFGVASILEPPRDGTSLDPYRVEQALISMNERNPVDMVVMDTSKAEQLASWVESEIGCTVIDRGQSNQFLTLDYAKFMEALRNGWLRHSGDGGLTSHVLNAVARVLPGGDARFDRPAQNRRSAGQDRRVIDALSAAAMVHTTASAVEASAWVGW